METLSEQLTELYESKWNGLMEQLEANGLRDKLQCPFLISLYRSGQEKEEREKGGIYFYGLFSLYKNVHLQHYNYHRDNLHM